LTSEIFPSGFSAFEEVVANFEHLIKTMVFVLIPILLAVNIEEIKDVLIFNPELEVDLVLKDGHFDRFIVVFGSESRFIVEVFFFNEVVNFFEELPVRLRGRGPFWSETFGSRRVNIFQDFVQEYFVSQASEIHFVKVLLSQFSFAGDEIQGLM